MGIYFLVFGSFALLSFITGSVETAGLICGSCCVIGLVVFLLYRRSPAYKKKLEAASAAEAELKSLVSFNRFSNTLELHKRSPLISELIKIEANHDYSIGYQPVTLHVGSVSVGNVTTGGAYTTGGYNYIASSKKNGLFSLIYVSGDDRKIINQIQLSDADFQAALNSPLAEYLDTSKKQIVVIERCHTSEWEARQIIRNIETQGYAGSEFAHKGYPTYEKANCIMCWLTTPDASLPLVPQDHTPISMRRTDERYIQCSRCMTWQPKSRRNCIKCGAPVVLKDN